MQRIGAHKDGLFGRYVAEVLALLAFGEHHGVGTEAILEPSKGPADQWGIRVRSVFPMEKWVVLCFSKKCRRQAGQQWPQSDMRYKSSKLYRFGNRTAANCPQCAPVCRKQSILRGHR